MRKRHEAQPRGTDRSAHQMPEVIDRILQVYVRERNEDERFIDTARRIGVAPFKDKKQD